jgi:hypothetical protein
VDNTARTILEIIRDSHLATGVDTSKYNQSVDYDQAEFAGVLDVVDYAMIRGSVCRGDGSLEKDPLLDASYAELKEHPSVVRDVYHYLGSARVWTQQYDFFLDAIDGKDFEILTMDGERIYNVKSAKFAGYAYYFLKQLIKDFPDKRVKFYSNRYDYMDWFRRYYNFDGFDYHHAQYPWARWDNVSPYWLPKLYEDLKAIFSGQTTPNLPDSRKPDNYVLWQVGAYTGIGLELGYGSDYLDINVSKMPLEDFRQWAGLYRRWQPEDPEPKPEPLTVEERLDRLEQAVFG